MLRNCPGSLLSITPKHGFSLLDTSHLPYPVTGLPTLCFGDLRTMQQVQVRHATVRWRASAPLPAGKSIGLFRWLPMAVDNYPGGAGKTPLTGPGFRFHLRTPQKYSLFKTTSSSKSRGVCPLFSHFPVKSARIGLFFPVRRPEKNELTLTRGRCRPSLRFFPGSPGYDPVSFLLDSEY